MIIRRSALLIAVLFGLVASPLLAQETKVEQLQTLLQAESDDPSRLELRKELSVLLALSDSARAADCITEGIALAERLKDEESKRFFEVQQGMLLFTAGQYEQAKSHCKAILEQSTSPLVKGHCLQVLGRYYNSQKQDSLSLASHREALELFESLEHLTGIAESANSLGMALSDQGQNPLALEAFEKSIQAYRLGGNEIGASTPMINKAIVYGKEDKKKEALSLYTEALALQKKIGNKGNVAATLNKIGNVHVQLQDYAKAIPYYLESLKIKEELGDKRQIAMTLSNLGNVYRKAGNLQEALRFYERSIALSIEIGDKRGEGISLNSMGNLYRKEGDDSLASIYYKRSLNISKETGDKLGAAFCLMSLGQIYLEDPNKEELAFTHFNEAFAICKEMNYTRWLRTFLKDIGSWYTTQGNIARALEFYSDALKLVEETKDTLGKGDMYTVLASLNESQGNTAEALTYQQQALEQYQTISHASRIAGAKTALADLYVNSGQYQQAFDHALQGLVAFQEMQDTCSFSPAYLTMGTASAALQQYEAARLYLQDALRYAEKCSKGSDIARAAIALGQVYQTEQVQTQAITYFERALASAQKTKERELIKEAAGMLYPYYQQRGLYEKAFETLNLYQANKDSLFNEANTRTLVQKEMEYAYAQEQQEAAMERQQAEAAQQRVLDRQKWLTYMFIGGFVAALLIALAVYRNFRNKQKANILLRKQKAELEELDHLKSRLFANISHELRTPLTLISSPVESLLHEPQGLNAQARAKLDLVQRNSQQLRGLVDDILDLSKLESNRVELHEEPTALAPFLRRVFSNFESLATHLELNYSSMISGLDDAWLQIDAGKVEKVLNNLLSNAVKHTPSGGLVRLLASKTEGRLQLRVEDTGQGIAAADLPHIFDRFFQSKQPDAPIQGGTGIGLALARELVQLMGGSISVESEVGKGSCFTVLLPWQEVAAQEQAPESTEVQETENISLAHLQLSDVPDAEKRFTVLVVEDHPDMQQFVSGLLRMRYKVKLAGNGKEALDVLAREHIDLIVTDVMMPEMDGYTLLQHLKAAADLRAIPVIMLTALDSEDKKLDALTLGVDDYLTKPFSPEELLARTYNLLLRYEARQEEARLSPDDHATAPDTPTRAVENPAPAPQEQAVSSSPAALAQELEVLETSESEAAWLQEVAEEIRKELENPDFQLNDLADRLLLSEQQFYRKMKKITGLPPKKYQQEVALQEARKLLEKGAYGNVTAICFSVGMSNVSRFSQLYEARFGKKPKAYFK